MRFKIYDIVRERYLSTEELEGQYYNTGQFDRTFPDPGEYTEEFRINLLTGKVQTDHDNACVNLSCCTPCQMFTDDDNFRLEIDE
jgi:hypothetical protein